jgi:hypothetical protein
MTTMAARQGSTRAGCHHCRPGIKNVFASLHLLPLLAPQQHRWCDLCHVQRPLEVECMRTSVLPSFYALLYFFPVGITMIDQPCHRRSGFPHPRPIQIPTGGTPQPPRRQILPCLF